MIVDIDKRTHKPATVLSSQVDIRTGEKNVGKEDSSSEEEGSRHVDRQFGWRWFRTENYDA